MEDVFFESKIPEDILFKLYDVAAEYDIDPLSSLESENYFCNLISNYQGEADGLMQYLDEQIKRDFIAFNEKPEWLQGQDWQFNNGKPMSFVGQIEAVCDLHGTMFYVFWDSDTGITKTIMQSD